MKKNFYIADDLDGGYFKAPGDLESGYFKAPGDLESGYFKAPGDLESGYFKAPGDLESGYFKAPGDLGSGYFKAPGDLNNDVNISNIDDYLSTVVSGKRYSSVCELGVLRGSGRVIVGLNELKKMVDDGYNIVFANVMNDSANMIEVEYQEFVYDDLIEKRRRF